MNQKRSLEVQWDYQVSISCCLLLGAIKPRIRLGLSKSSITSNSVTKTSNPTSIKAKESSKVEKPTIKPKENEVKPKVEQKKVSQLHPTSKPSSLTEAKPNSSKEQARYFKCLHCKRSNKKHKTYDDGKKETKFTFSRNHYCKRKFSTTKGYGGKCFRKDNISTSNLSFSCKWKHNRCWSK